MTKTKFCIWLVFAILFLGCKHQSFYSHHSGENDIIGLRFPVSETTSSQLEILHHLNGEILTVKDPSDIIHHYEVINRNSYFGIISIDEKISGIISIGNTNTNHLTTADK